jgi:Secretion system C-terminal sorting domain/SprB repeat/Cohesin domain
MNRFSILKRPFLVLFLVLFCLFSFFQMQAQSGGLTIGQMTSCPGKTIEVIVQTDIWTNVTSMQFTLEWDETVLEFVNHATPNNTFMDINFGETFIADGKLGASWFDNSPTINGVSTSGAVTCFVVTFNVIGELGDETGLDFVNEPTVIEFSHNINGNLSIYEATLVNGSVKLESPTIVSSQITDASFANNDGAITVVAEGGTSAYTYLWNDGNNGPSITNLPAGDYYCTVSDANGCSSENGPFVVQALPSSAKEIEGLRAFELSPNPASDLLNVHVAFTKNENANIRVLSVTGKVLYQANQTGSDFSVTIPLADFSNGTYFLEIKTESGTSTEKVVVIK